LRALVIGRFVVRIHAGEPSFQIKFHEQYNYTVKIFFVLSVIILALLVFPQNIYACSCNINPSPQQSLEKSGAVFSGKVLRVNRPMIDTGHNRVTIAVKEIWKGDIYEEITIYTPAQSPMCGYDFEEGKEYLIYANEWKDTLTVSLCSRTQLLSAATEDLQDLGEGKKPIKGNLSAPYAQQLGLGDLSNYSLVGMGLLLSTLLGFFLGRRTR
jgi:hypothetical protein